MESINFLMIFDIVILGYGFLIVRGALQMHKTNVPASMLIPAEELTGCKDPVGFCEANVSKDSGIWNPLYCLWSGLHDQ